jgi:hypothetical protein
VTEREKNHDWLALTVEGPIEPGLPICDPRHHLWDRETGRHVQGRRRHLTSGYSAAEKAKLFHDTAARVYRWAVDMPAPPLLRSACSSVRTVRDRFGPP